MTHTPPPNLSRRWFERLVCEVARTSSESADYLAMRTQK